MAKTNENGNHEGELMNSCPDSSALLLLLYRIDGEMAIEKRWIEMEQVHIKKNTVAGSGFHASG
jgi:hypothetical protein